jgi:DNA primase catalytic core
LARISEAQLEQIRQRADIVLVIKDRVALEKKGRDFVGRCPFHEEKTPSFYVTPAKQFWYCHGSCKKGGNVFQFVQEAERVSFPEAARILAQRFGVVLEEETPEERARSRRRADLLDTIRRAADFYHRCLFEKTRDPVARAAREFLERRGVREETARAWKIGVAPAGSSLLKIASKKSPASVTFLRELGLVRDSQHGPRDFFHERLLFPIADEAGRTIAFGGRKLREEDEPKFLNSRELPGFFEKKRVLYGLDRAREARPRPERLVVVEGYLDVVIAHQEGAQNVVGALSTAFTREHASLAKRFADGGVVILFDGDAAGRTSSRRVLEELLELDLDARVASLPAGMDPDDFILKRGREAFEALVRGEAREPFDYLLDTSLAKSEGKPSAPLVGECARLLGLYPDEIRRELALRRVSERLRFPEDVLRREVLKARALPRRDARPQGTGELAPESQAILAENADRAVLEILGPHACAGESFEVHILEAFLARPDVARATAAQVRAEDFTRGPLRDVANAVLDAAGSDVADEAFLARVLERTGAAGPTAEGVVARLLARIHEHPGKAYDAELEGVPRLERRRREARLTALTREMADAYARGDADAGERLLREKVELEKQTPIVPVPASRG